MNNLFAELKRRNIFRVAGVYAVVGWLIIQLGIALETSLNLPGWFDTLVTTLVLIGFPIAMIFAWAFELTPEGVKRTDAISPGDSITDITGRRLDYAIVGGLALVAALVVWQTTKASNSVSPQTANEQTVLETRSIDAQKTESEIKTETVDGKQSIAVLPFADLSPNKDQDYFARGISEELLNVLAKTKGLRVSSRTSAFAFKDQGTPIAQIAKELDVGHILEGSVRKSGETLRITAQLIDTNSDVHRWSETYDRPLTIDNIFDIQDEIAAAIVKALKGQLTITPEATSRPVSLEAFEIYIKAREDHNKRLPERLKAAEAGFLRVISLDPDFAPAYSGLADTYILMVNYAGLIRKEAVSKATPMVARAIGLAPDSAEALTSAAYLELERLPREINKAEALARRAIDANPNYATAHHRLATSLRRQGRTKEALISYQHGRKLDPISAILLRNVSEMQLLHKQYGAAQFGGEELLRLHPDSSFGYLMLSQVELVNGNYAQSHVHSKDAFAMNPDNNPGARWLREVYYAVGLPDHASLYSVSLDDKAYHAVVEGNYEKARQNIEELLEWFQRIILYRIRDFKSARPLMISYAQRRSFLENPIEQELHAGVILEFAYVAREMGEPFSQYIEKLSAYYDDLPAAQVSDGFSLRNRARFEILKGEPEKSYKWIDRYQALGFVTEKFDEPFFDEIRDSAEFKKRLAVNETLRAKYRKEIEAQLANPKPNWKLPED